MWWFREREETRVLRGSVYDEMQRTNNGALGNATGGGIQERENVLPRPSSIGEGIEMVTEDEV